MHDFDTAKRVMLMYTIGQNLGIILLCAAPSATTDKPVAGPMFERDVHPILKEHCFQCHGETGVREGELDLRLRRLASRGGESGPAIVAGNVEKSLLFQRIIDQEMPPGEKKLHANEVAVIRQWIAAGARTARPEPEQLGDESLFTLEERQFWSFRPIIPPTVPKVRAADRVRTPIDAFLLARLEKEGLSFGPDADKVTLLRRATFDLTGLPPTIEQIERFMTDTRAGAYDRLLDRLIASPHYGERWGRFWLDVAGYADSEGHNEDDVPRPNAYRYRDYVIRSIAADKPFDEFIREQLAGDEMLERPFDNLTPEQAEKLIATGFLRMAPDGTALKGVDVGLASNEGIADTMKIVSTSLLGMTVGCAQCHDHRYDPIPQKDYYRLRAIFEPAFDWKKWRVPNARRVSLYTDADRAAAKKVEAAAVKLTAGRTKRQKELVEKVFERELAKLPKEQQPEARAARDTPAAKRNAAQKKLLKEQPSLNVTAGNLRLFDSKAAAELQKMADAITKVRAKKPVEQFVRALTEIPGNVPETHLFARGDHEQPRDAVTPADLGILADASTKDMPINSPDLATTGRRRAYANRLTDGTHPLVARVLVNRFWLNHFGAGIVTTPADFGVLGERPSHPLLLDWLATDFMENGWRLARLHRLIMTSTAYRQSSVRRSEAARIDPDSRLLWCKPIRRLDAEAVRDATLAISGSLWTKAFGPPIPVMADTVGQFVIGKENLNAGRPGPVLPMHGEQYRRSVFVQFRRSRPLAVMSTFDAPAMEPNCEIRVESTVATQALMMMNSDFVVQQSLLFARRVEKEVGADTKAQANQAWRMTLGLEPPESRLVESVKFLEAQTAHFRSLPKPKKNPKAPIPPTPETQALATLCQALLGSNAFLYVE